MPVLNQQKNWDGSGCLTGKPDVSNIFVLETGTWLGPTSPCRCVRTISFAGVRSLLGVCSDNGHLVLRKHPIMEDTDTRHVSLQLRDLQSQHRGLTWWPASKSWKVASSFGRNKATALQESSYLHACLTLKAGRFSCRVRRRPEQKT